MSKINGDKARDAKRAKKNHHQRLKNQSLRDMFVLPLKTTLRPAEKPKSPKSEKGQAEKAKAEK